MNHPFLDLRPEYETLLATMEVDPMRAAEVDAVAHRLVPLAHTVYLGEQQQTAVPAPFLASLDEREDGADQTRAIGQGDRWDRVSINVPRGKGPFGSKLEADLFYIRWDHLDVCSQPWLWAYACWKAEMWNGAGPRAHGIHTGYLWAGTNHYQRGKYISDGQWHPNFVDQQLGLVPVLKRIVEMAPELSFDPAGFPPMQPGMSAPTYPALAPVGVRLAGIHDVAWAQAALDKVFLPADSLLVVDGSMGRMTRTALRAYQAARHLTPDGLFGPQTEGQLELDLTKS